MPWAQFCRGGGRASDNDILEGLQEFLDRFRNAPAKGDTKGEAKGSVKGKGKHGKGKEARLLPLPLLPIRMPALLRLPATRARDKATPSGTKASSWLRWRNW